MVSKCVKTYLYMEYIGVTSPTDPFTIDPIFLGHSIINWLVYRDPYVMAYEIIPKNNWAGNFIPYIT